MASVVPQTVLAVLHKKTHTVSCFCTGCAAGWLASVNPCNSFAAQRAALHTFHSSRKLLLPPCTATNAAEASCRQTVPSSAVAIAAAPCSIMLCRVMPGHHDHGGHGGHAVPCCGVQQRSQQEAPAVKDCVLLPHVSHVKVTDHGRQARHLLAPADTDLYTTTRGIGGRGISTNVWCHRSQHQPYGSGSVAQ